MSLNLLPLTSLGAVESNGTVTFGLWLPWVSAGDGNALTVKIIHEAKRLSVAVPRRRAPSLANSNSGARGQRPFSGVHGDPPTHIRVASVLSRTLQRHRDQIPPERPISSPPSLHQERSAVLAAR